MTAVPPMDPGPAAGGPLDSRTRAGSERPDRPPEQVESRRLDEVEVVEDRTPGTRCDQGFLKVTRLTVRNRYDDGSHSAPYPCDLVRRPGSDAVVAVLYDRGPDGTGAPRVLLREAIRVPIHLRKDHDFVHPDPGVYRSIREVVAGIVEPDDPAGQPGFSRRAQAEALEEAGLELPRDAFAALGGETFASPGITDEKLYFQAARCDLDARGEITGDGSIMEEWAVMHVESLDEAIAACRRGEVPDMKTEVALLRLADHIGWIPQLGMFDHELPPELAVRASSLGVARRAEDGRP